MKQTLKLAGLAALLGATLATSGARAVETAPSRVAQARPPTPPAAPAPAASAAPPAAAPAVPPPPQPIRTEIIAQDNWTITCRDFADKRHTCSGTLQVVQQPSNQVLFVWVVGKNVEGKLMSVLQTPTGVMLAPGIELKFVRGAVRRATFVRCDPNQCEATLDMDDALVRDASASETVDATVIGTNTQTAKFSLPFKGFDKAVAAVR